MPKSVRFPCGICNLACGNTNCLDCSGCSQWIHCECIPMDTKLLELWNGEDLQFLCPTCIGGKYDPKAGLQRLNIKPSLAASEKLLMRTYKAALPPPGPRIGMGPTCPIATDILRLYQPVMLFSKQPLAVIGDGNCLYRAVSRALYGNEDHHVFIRLLTALELIDNQRYYDPQHPEYIDMVNDVRVSSPPYRDLLEAATKLGEYSDMLHIFAISAVIKQPIKSYYPPTGNDYLTLSLNRSVSGRSVRYNDSPDMCLMWSAMKVPTTVKDFQANHFVVLRDSKDIETTPETVVVSDDDLPSESIPSTVEVNDGHDNEEDDGEENESMQDYHHRPIAKGGFPIDRTLSLEDSIIKLMSAEEVLDSVPTGLKENVAFVVDDTRNVERRKRKMKSEFYDDCGSWGRGSSPSYIYIKGEPMKLVPKKDGDGNYCLKKQVKGKVFYIPMDPQPLETDLVYIHRNYSECPGKGYSRRITWITSVGGEDGPTRALYEYVGTYPGDRPHGNAKDKTTTYIRTKGEVMEKIGVAAQHTNPAKTYRHLKRTLPFEEHPTNHKQVKNKKYNDAKKLRLDSRNPGNLADICYQEPSIWTGKCHMYSK